MLRKSGRILFTLLSAIVIAVFCVAVPGGGRAEGAGLISFSSLPGRWIFSNGSGTYNPSSGSLLTMKLNSGFANVVIKSQNAETSAIADVTGHSSWTYYDSSGNVQEITDGDFGNFMDNITFTRTGDNTFKANWGDTGNVNFTLEVAFTSDSSGSVTFRRQRTTTTEGIETFNITKVNGDDSGGDSGDGESESGGGCSAGIGVIGMFALAIASATTSGKKTSR
jgi:hypothetical protein